MDTYEKKYKDAIPYIKDLIEHNVISKESVGKYFPELAESEDERIRKALIKGFNECLDLSSYPKNAQKYWHGIAIEDIFAWLEKQGEKLPVGFYYVNNEGKKFYSDTFKYGDVILHVEKQGGTDNCPLEYSANTVMTDSKKNQVKPKFKVGDWIVSNEKLYVYQIEEINDFVVKVNENGVSFVVDVKCLNDAHLWTIQDAKDGDVLYCKSSGVEYIIILKQLNNRSLDSYCRYNTIDGFAIDVPRVMSIQDNPKPATKEQRDLLFSKMKEAGYEWNAEKKELNKTEQKSAWSEEDAFRTSSLTDVVKSGGSIRPELRNEFVDWLNSLKQRIGG